MRSKSNTFDLRFLHGTQAACTHLLLLALGSSLGSVPDVEVLALSALLAPPRSRGIVGTWAGVKMRGTSGEEGAEYLYPENGREIV